MRTLSLIMTMIALTIFTSAASAQIQPLSGEFASNPAAVGPVSLTVESTVSVGLNSGCGLIAVYQGSPTGPVVYSPMFCPFLIINVGPGFPHTITWQGTDNAGNLVAPDTYYIRVNYYDNVTGVSYPDAYFPVRLDDPNAPQSDPILSTTGPATLGGTLGLSISAPADGFGNYAIAAAFSTNQGLTISPTQHFALDQDLLWDLSFPNPHTSLFTGFMGTLDANGLTSMPTMTIPNVPALQGGPIAFQGIVLGSGLKLTNPLSVTLH